MWLGCAWLALMTILGAFVQRKAGAHAAVMVAGVYSVGVLGMAWLTSRVTEYPRWAWFASAGVFVLTLAAAAARFPAPAQVKEWVSMAWMLPWLYLVMASSPAPAKGWCSPRAAWGGPLLLGMSAVFSSILLVVSELNR
jgi:hypothetical protein